MAFLFSRQSKNTKTWYVGYYVDRKYVRKRIGRSKAFAEKACGEIEAKIERKEAGLLQKDYPLRHFFEEYLERTEMRHSASYQNRNDLVIRNFLRFIENCTPHLSKLSQIIPHVIEEYQRFRLSENTVQGIRKRTTASR